MSRYTEFSGTLYFKDELTADKARNFLIQGGYLTCSGIDELSWVDETSTPVDDATTPAGGCAVRFLGGNLRNLAGAVEHILENMQIDEKYSHLRSFSNDGGFDLAELRQGKLVYLDDIETLKITGAPSIESLYECEDEGEYEDKAWAWL